MRESSTPTTAGPSAEHPAGATAGPSADRAGGHSDGRVNRPHRLVWVGRELLACGGVALGALLLTLVVPVIALLCVVGVGLMALPTLGRLTHRLADVERRRLRTVLGRPVGGGGGPVGGGLRHQVADLLTSSGWLREVWWLAVQGVTGTLTAFVGLALPVTALNDVTMVLWWWAVPGPAPSGVGFAVDSWPRALVMIPVGALLCAVAWWVSPRLLRGQARLSRRLLSVAGGTSLTERLAEVTASRAEALEAHGAELRRIERDLHDGTQNKLVGVVMYLGLIERALAHDPASALPLVGRTRQVATDALDELRAVVRSIYPPILDERGLDGATAALAARCPVPCTLDTDGLTRAPAAVETAAYFIVAEALNNVAKHSAADRVLLRLFREEDNLVVEVRDDGRGGADPAAGSGLAGIARRARALDGRVTVHSPSGGPTRVRAELPCGS